MTFPQAIDAICEFQPGARLTTLEGIEIEVLAPGRIRISFARRSQVLIKMTPEVANA